MGVPSGKASTGRSLALTAQDEALLRDYNEPVAVANSLADEVKEEEEPWAKDFEHVRVLYVHVHVCTCTRRV